MKVVAYLIGLTHRSDTLDYNSLLFFMAFLFFFFFWVNWFAKKKLLFSFIFNKTSSIPLNCNTFNKSKCYEHLCTILYLVNAKSKVRCFVSRDIKESFTLLSTISRTFFNQYLSSACFLVSTHLQFYIIQCS